MLNKLYVITLLIFSITTASAQSTRLWVRAKAKDAKFIGTGIGGAYVTVKNHLTGELLAKGLTTGGSGNTDVIMKNPIVRGQSITDSTTAKFEASVAITEPTFVDIEVTAPVVHKSAAIKVSTQLWLIPGKDILGEGIVLEIPGFILHGLYPTIHEMIKLESLKKGELIFKANLTLMCGCPITKGGVWNSDDIDIKAIVKKDGAVQKEVPLSLATTQPNTFEGKLNITAKGVYELLIYAYDTKTGNTGVDTINFVIQ